MVTAYDIVVVPEATPVTTPEALTVAADVLLLLHTPPPVASLIVVVAPGHTVVVPVMDPADGNGLTVTIEVA